MSDLIECIVEIVFELLGDLLDASINNPRLPKPLRILLSLIPVALLALIGLLFILVLPAGLPKGIAIAITALLCALTFLLLVRKVMKH